MKKTAKMKVLGAMVAILALMVVSAVAASADPASRTGDQYYPGYQYAPGYQYGSEQCTQQVVGPIVQGEPTKQECVPPGVVVPF